MRPLNPWQDAFAFLLLVNATLVLVLVLVATRHYWDEFGGLGRALSGVVVFVSVLALATLAASLVRLYVRPALANGRDRLRRNP